MGCGAYVRLMGQQRMDEIYKNYEAYVSASTSEGFGLTLMEAIGSGLPVIGFDVPYGNQTFIDEGENGYRIPVHDKMEKRNGPTNWQSGWSGCLQWMTDKALSDILIRRPRPF